MDFSHQIQGASPLRGDRAIRSNNFFAAKGRQKIIPLLSLARLLTDSPPAKPFLSCTNR
jgi:hypothetical protein